MLGTLWLLIVLLSACGTGGQALVLTPELTATAVPPAPSPMPLPSAPPVPTGAAGYPAPTLLSPDPEFDCYNREGCDFSWSWGGTLGPDEYFQVQLVGPGGEHRGIHPPTKEYSFHANWSVYQIFADWCDVSQYCHIYWTVAVIQWDGKDPSRIGRTLVEAAPRSITL